MNINNFCSFLKHALVVLLIPIAIFVQIYKFIVQCISHKFIIPSQVAYVQDRWRGMKPKCGTKTKFLRCMRHVTHVCLIWVREQIVQDATKRSPLSWFDGGEMGLVLWHL
jgi:hypothetical protein